MKFGDKNWMKLIFDNSVKPLIKFLLKVLFGFVLKLFIYGVFNPLYSSLNRSKQMVYISEASVNLRIFNRSAADAFWSREPILIRGWITLLVVDQLLG
jgi:hypothetical protein